jgi:uncharacterized membrane-anchored protein
MDWRQLVLAALCAASLIPVASAQQEPQEAQQSPESQAAQAATEAADPNAAVWDAAKRALVPGPATIQIRDQATLALPEGYGFVPKAEGARIMEIMGNTTDERFEGLIYPLGDEASAWFVTVDYEASGYIKDEDAKEWDADELLESLKQGTESGNKHREKLGIDPIEVTRWVESPAYDPALRHLVWSAELRNKHGEDPDPGVNYNTYVLGREGYISLCLVTALSAVEAEKPAARELLAAVSFNSGKRYEDFNASTDKVAAYGLAALVGGVAAKKLGLLGALAAIVAKFGKVILVAVVALGGGLLKWFKTRRGSG